jgi:UDP-N-acetylmuramate dehydrogenase
MLIQSNYSLQQFNTFHLDSFSEQFCAVQNEDDAVESLLYARNKELFILGGGSNILLVGNVKGLTLHNQLKGIEKVKEDDNYVWVKASAGENWHTFVLHCIENNWAGVENLSLIPGTVGAGPMQNIGAYGVELKDVFYSLEAIHTQTLEKRTFTHADCQFDYRSSVFKTSEKGNYLITSVTFQLNKKPVFHTSYGAIEQELEKMKVNELSIRAISNAVIQIRQSKLPDPAQIGNAGSFFKNPLISVDHYKSLQFLFPNIPSYPVNETNVKVPAGWLIEQAGWKGKTIGEYGVHIYQALVLVNYGKAKGKDILQLSNQIIEDISLKFNIQLEREVNVIGQS